MALHEIQNYAWIITSGNRAWIYDGTKSGLKGAVERIKDLPHSAGNTVRVKQVVK